MSVLKMTAVSLSVLLGLGVATANAQSSAKRYESYERTAPTAAPTDTSSAMPSYVLAAVADTARPAEDRLRDHDRKPGEVVAFSGVKPGDTVVDLIPGGGYFTRIFDKVVGPHGQIIAFVPESLARVYPAAVTAAKAIPTAAAYGDVKVVVEPFSDLTSHGPLDIVWTAQNYHDMHNPSVPPTMALMMDRLIFSALRPGGVFIIEDHAAEPGAGLRDAGTLHRISQGAVRDEVESAGFVFAGESQVLHNPADDHTKKVFDPSIRGHTDQFILKFRKPT